MSIRTANTKLDACVLLAVILGLATVASAVTRSVPAVYPTIQAAIEAAAGEDEIVVAPGTYHENINFYGKPVTVRSSAGAATTTIDGGNNDRTVLMTGLGNGGTLEGFTIINGGVYVQASSPHVRNCTFTMNMNQGYGGAIYIGDNSSPTITSCTFTQNYASAEGGAIRVTSGQPTIIESCTFEQNQVGAVGGSIYADGSSTQLIVRDCSITGGAASEGGGGAAIRSGASATFERCTLTANTAPNGGGIFNVWETNCDLQECSLNGNTATNQGGAIFNCCGASVSAAACTFTQNGASGGGAIFSIDPESSLSVTRSFFSYNSAGWAGGAIQLHQTRTGTIRNCSFTGNSGGYGGAINAEGASIWMTFIADGCLFDVNTAPEWGQAGAIRSSQLTSDSRISNCTIVDNTGPTAAIVFNQPGSLLVVNSILSGNLQGPVGPPSQLGGDGVLEVTYSLVQGGYLGSGNIDADPDFVNPGSGDYHLQVASPCIDAGLDSAVPAELQYDLDGNARTADGDGDGTAAVDMGAYERGTCALAITGQPVSQSIHLGQTASFSVAAGGGGSLEYRWSKNGSLLSDGGHISGSTTSTLTVGPVESGDQGVYWVTVTASCGTVTSTPASLSIACDLTITQQPTSQPLEIGSTVIFSVSASGTGTLDYQWRKDGTNLADDGRVLGATTSMLTMSSLQLTDDGEYDVVVNNGCASVTSQSAVLSVSQPKVLKPLVLKMFGQRGRGEAASGPVTGHNIYHASGVVVDRSLTPNAIYTFDTGHNRVLGFRSYASQDADRVFGQPDAYSSAANGNCNIGLYGTPSSTSLCLTSYPIGTNVAEQWMRLHLDVDAQGNLYVPDTYNDRILVYFAPFSDNHSAGRGDTVADLVLGQSDFNSNGANRGRGPGSPDAQSLHISLGGFDHVASRGVSVDPAGNVWVADTFNYRVLRFPPGATVADLVLGQVNFTTCEAHPGMSEATLATMCTPTIARVDPETGELYVVDEYPSGFPARILVFKPPFTNGMLADRLFPINQLLQGDYSDGYRLTHATGLIFNPYKTDEWIDPVAMTHRYRDGLLWLNDSTRCMLLDGSGNILLAVGAPDTITFGGRYDVYGRSGLDPTIPFNLLWPGGSIGFDSDNNIYLADEGHSAISRYTLPYRVHQTANGLALPAANGGLFPTQPIDAVHWTQDRVGMTVFRDQLIVRDNRRYMVWNDYMAKPDGAPADLFIGQDGSDNINRPNHIVDRSHHAIDDRGRLWAGSEHGKMMLYQLPFEAGTEPLRTLIPLYWADDPDTEVPYRTGAVAFDPFNRHLWVVDGSRLLRVRNPDDWSSKLLVDAVIGQSDKTSNSINRGMSAPDAASLGSVNSIQCDRLGNLFVVDNNYECHPNGRVIAFPADGLAQIQTMFPSIQATKVYSVQSFNETHICQSSSMDYPFSPVSIAFSSRNEMVIGNDGYYREPTRRAVRQLYLYRRPLEKATPDAVIELPLGAAAEMHFDDSDHLVVLDHTWNRAWVLDILRCTEADLDGSGVVDGDDLAVFAACATGPAVPYDPAALPAPQPGCGLTPDSEGKIAADFDRDGDVDMADFGAFQTCYGSKLGL